MAGSRMMRLAVLCLLSFVLSDLILPVHCRLLASVEADSLITGSTRRILQYYGGSYGYYGYRYPGWGIALVCVVVAFFLVFLSCSCFMRRRALKRYQDGIGPAPMFYRGQQYPAGQVVTEGYPATQQYPNQQYPNQQYPNQHNPNQQYPNQQYGGAAQT